MLLFFFSVERFLLWPLYLLSVCVGALTTGWNWSPPEERTREVPNVPDTYSCTGNLLRKHRKEPGEGSRGECHCQGGFGFLIKMKSLILLSNCHIFLSMQFIRNQ